MKKQKENLNIYLPMTANILTVGHIKCIEQLYKQGTLTIGLLTAKALEGYKKEVVPFEERRYILQSLNFPCIWIVPQNSLDPTSNIIKYECEAIASGDGWEDVEEQAIKKLKLKKINIKLRGEIEKKFSSSKILGLSTGDY